MWVVDTCVLIDLLRRDEAFATLAADALDAKKVGGTDNCAPYLR